MEKLDDFILSLTDKEKKEAEKQKSSRKYISDSEDEAGYSDEVGIEDEEELEDVDEYGPDLYKNEEDRRKLEALPEVQRERILAERSEERQRNLERLEVRKLLKYGRREDTTRRSTRSKGAGTSHALNELARRREEKNKTQRKRHRDTPSPERKKHRRSGYGDSEDYSEDERSEEETEKRAKKRTPTLDEVVNVSVTRHMIEKWLYAPFFEDTVIGCFVRLYIGNDPSKKVAVYRLCQVIDIVPWHKVYKVGEGIYSNKALKVKHGKAERPFPMDIVSNQPINQQEFGRFLTTLENERVKLPSLDEIEQKAKDIKHAKDYVLNDKEVDQMLAKKKAVNGSSVNAAVEKAQLLARLEHAKESNQVDDITRITREIRELEERTATLDTTSKQDIWADLNKRNRERDRIEVHEAERKLTEERRKGMLKNLQASKSKEEAELAEGNTAADSSLMPNDKPNKPMVKLFGLSKDAVNVGEATSYQTEYERLVTKVAAEIYIELEYDSDDENLQDI
ncbi:plus-3-domain-containing protein [Backusella circina FSU 941]|nr:plus-3-domain-containing protein [Backusella circina FSU 941]